MGKSRPATDRPSTTAHVAIFTVAKVTSYRAVPSFTFYALATIIGSYAAPGNREARFRLRSPLAWYTMTVWESDEAMMTYVRRPAHRAAMRASRKMVAQHGVVRTQVQGSLKDLDWNDIYPQVDEAAAASARSSVG